MRRSRAVVLLAALALSGVTARLGVWQLDRASGKLAVQHEIDTRRNLPPVHTDELARSQAAADAQHYRPVQLEGRWLASYTVYLDNRPMAGRVGFIVVTPLALADGTSVLVQRGWLPRDQLDRTRVSAQPLPESSVKVVGRIAPPPGRLYEFDSASTGAIRQNIDLVEFARETRLALRPLSVQLLDRPGAPSDGLLRDWPLPAANVHMHYGYAFQWFALSALTVILYVWFQIIRPRRSRPEQP